MELPDDVIVGRHARPGGAIFRYIRLKSIGALKHYFLANVYRKFGFSRNGPLEYIN